MKKKIIIDTNFLFMPARHRVDIFSEIGKICDFDYDIYVLDKTLDELNKVIKEGKGSERDEAKLGLSLVRIKNPKVLKTNVNFQGKSVDDILVGISDRDVIVATQDKNLKERLIGKGVSVIILRQKKKLEFVRA